MKLNFFKYQATGNDFILINGFNEDIELSTDQISFLCDRHFGIGADGLIILRPDTKTDFFMDFYNPDGSLAGFCGNGGRSSALFAYHQEIVKKQQLIFSARDGDHLATIVEKDLIKLQLINACDIKIYADEYYINTGTHHVVIFVDDVETMDIIPFARKVRYNERYKPEGTNVNFVQVVDQQQIKVRTYEKGVEDETLSCGTGTVASALITAYAKNFVSPIEVITRGGKLKVFFHRQDNCFDNIYLQGPAHKVFYGEIDL